jgi:hypothetical protein
MNPLSEESHNQAGDQPTAAQLQAQILEVTHSQQVLQAQVQFLSQENEQLRILHEGGGQHDPYAGAENPNVVVPPFPAEHQAFPPPPPGPPPPPVIPPPAFYDPARQTVHAQYPQVPILLPKAEPLLPVKKEEPPVPNPKWFNFRPI